jgi:hypothetical protein
VHPFSYQRAGGIIWMQTLSGGQVGIGGWAHTEGPDAAQVWVCRLPLLMNSQGLPSSFLVVACRDVADSH